MKVGRNDPCLCGSGKKYKKCCLVEVESNDFEHRRHREIEKQLARRLIDYALETFGPSSLHDAWKEFNCVDEIEELAIDSPINVLFIPWYLFYWEFESVTELTGRTTETTISELFCVDHEDELSNDEIDFLDAASGAPYSLCEIIKVKPGISLRLRDLFTQAEYDILERVGSEKLQPGEIIYCATIQVGNIRLNLATAPFALRPTAKNEVMKLRDLIVEAVGRDNLTDADLCEADENIRILYLNLVDRMLAPPQLVNTDNEPFLPQKVDFDLNSVDEAFHLLKDLAGEENIDRLKNHSTVENGRVIAAEIPWGGGNAQAKLRFGNPVLLGVLKLSEGRLVAEVNSTARAESIRLLIEERLGNQVKYKSTVIEPIDIPFTEMWTEAASAGAGSSAGNRKVGFSGKDIVGGISQSSLTKPA